MADNERLGASFSIDTTNLKAGLSQANRLIRESQSEFQAAAAGMDDWTKSEDGLNAKIRSLNQITDVQRKKVDALQSEYDQLITNGLDPTSKEAVELRTKINNETAALNKNETEIQQQIQALRDLKNEQEDTGEATDEATESINGWGVVGNIAVGAIAAIGAAVAGAITGFFALAESTREARANMAKLETSFQTAGLSAENTENTFTELYGIMGDEGAATEAAQQLAKFSKDEKDLEANTRILTGVMAEYGNSIPTEGLAEGIASSIAMSSVQGPLADALEWQGVSLDDVNAKLESLSTEEERAAYLQETLTGLYGESADAYRENNAEVIAAQEAQAGLNAVLNDLGAIAEPIMTTLKQLATGLLISITPFVSLIGEGLTGALNGASGATDKLAEGLSGIITSLVEKIVAILPSVISTAVSIIATLLPQILSTLAAQLPVLLQAVISGATQILQLIGGMLPELIPIMIDAVLMCAETLIDNIDLIIDAGISLIMGLADGLLAALPDLINKIPVIIDKLIVAITNNLPKILQMGIELTLKLALGIIQAIPQLVSKIPQIISSLVSGLKNGISKIKEIGGDIIRGLWDGIKNMTSWIKEKIKGFGDSVLNGLKDFFGIKSPSRVMADQVGKNLALGIGTGFEKNIAGVNKEITDAMNFDDATVNVNANRAGVKGGGVTVYQTNNYKQAYTSPIEKYKSKQQLYATARLIKAGAI